MELSASIKKGLSFLSDLEKCHKTITNAFDIIGSSKKIITDNIQFSLVSVLVLASKHNCNERQLREILEEYIPNSDVIDKIVSKYILHRDIQNQKNAEFGISLPHVTDANWTLRSDLSSSSYSVSAGNLSFSIELESFEYKSNEKKPVVRFTCTPEELQLFITKLKEIELNCDRLTK
ncbi:COMM domain-containing protein 3-like [Malaya genurostris]|uniref:COMM domain-containing protein 3-like n=1 Tax=Malaya genurostris TaxID=325434 RepID=UPI0026F3C517|nr:COMM domain-containing protein 3-like [Malaya genurostris]XP_058462684.1 COMM domain-containing protein 3-like [Malaya genurostris]